MARGRTPISPYRRGGILSTGVEKEGEASWPGPSARQLSHAVRAASEQNCSLQLAKSNRSITTVMTPPRRRMLADMIGDI
jgi:hypothetical protein